MIRKIVQIEEDRCTGCGLCAHACHESAIAMVDGKAKLIRDDYCDGFGDCLPVCPADAISFVEREALPYDEEAVKENQRKAKEAAGQENTGAGKAGENSWAIDRADAQENSAAVPSRLRQWPVQIKLAPVHAPYFEGAKLLIAADCTAYAYANFHQEFMRGKVTLIGCPKLDAVDYSEKLTEILRSNDIQSVTILRMEVPCCGGLEMAANKALQASRLFIPRQVVTISIDGKILD